MLRPPVLVQLVQKRPPRGWRDIDIGSERGKVFKETNSDSQSSYPSVIAASNRPLFDLDL